MRIVRNVGHVKRRKRVARWMALLGFVLLAGIFVLVLLFPGQVLVAWAVMLIGFFVFNIGMQQVGKWNRPVRNDQVIDHKLDKLSDAYTAIHYAPIGKKVIEHLIVYPGGVLVLTARELSDDVFVKGRRWRKRGVGLRRLFGISGPQLGNPSLETDQAIAAVEGLLAEKQLAVEVGGAVVFTDPRVDVEADKPEYPVLLAEELPEFVRTLPPDPSIRPADRQRIVDVLSLGEELETNAPKARRRPVRRKAA
ncbi:MAG: hypothetical protein AVDCRST_MAG49-4043 [uncultured Thermomicrobiales bacterium]|uniref:NERD domain-containing protein n=1 Tax=uncultured Thermomicrobiales bacterium TaxID=1645740 RepID=A0A6J4VC14_9BACT|nr:MAG: hypothetical protein AVDCRST_MAG49-4043 [uncultured Thermomicrobiales bacterium]